jgi:hypothetical protein
MLGIIHQTITVAVGLTNHRPLTLYAQSETLQSVIGTPAKLHLCDLVITAACHQIHGEVYSV